MALKRPNASKDIVGKKKEEKKGREKNIERGKHIHVIFLCIRTISEKQE